MNLYDARLKFAIRSKMVQNVAFNYSSDPKYSSQLWHCTHCDRMDSQTHILSCDSYQYFRTGKDLFSDKDLVTYFREVISLREKIEKIPLAPMGVLTPVSAQTGSSDQPPIGTSGIFPAHFSAE